jgi:hypothetical protein
VHGKMEQRKEYTEGIRRRKCGDRKGAKKQWPALNVFSANMISRRRENLKFHNLLCAFTSLSSSKECFKILLLPTAT